MNTIIDVYDYTSQTGNTKSWEDILFPFGCPLPQAGELLYLCEEPDNPATSALEPYRVVSRSFYLQRNRVDNTPQVRVAISVVRFEEAEY